FEGSVQDITARKLALEALRNRTQTIKLLQEIAVEANASESIEGTLQFALDRICGYTSWPVGHVSVLDEATGELVSLKLWHLDRPELFGEFRRVSEEYRFRAGIGLPGRVLAEGRPAWIIDIKVDPNFPRSQLATELGVRGAFGFPILTGKDVVGVMEFFTSKPAAPNQDLLEVMAHVGTQLGRVFERRKSERSLRAAKTAAEAASTAKSEFLANMSHELRTPLNSVIGFAGVLLKNKGGALKPDEITYLSRILDNGRHLLGLIDQVLDLTRVEAGETRLQLVATD